jgi:peptidoglycan/xylan/chitin deacetylase (PgdA/CDA1 family)
MFAPLRLALCGVCKYGGLAWWWEKQAVRYGRSPAVILLFHRVNATIPEDGLTLHPQRFRRLCRLLQRRFQVVPLSAIFAQARSGAPLPPRQVAITFDDSYQDNYQAAEILAAHGLPATFFLPTAYIGTEHTFPWDAHLPRQPNLSWQEVRALAQAGFEIGSHTLTHPNLAQLPLAEARREIEDSRKVLEDQLGRPVRWFAYPFGGREHFREELLPLVAQAGYEGCLSGYGGFVQRGMTGLMLPRQPVPMPAFANLLYLEMFLRCHGYQRTRTQETVQSEKRCL